jgi:LmbE family N-acetylglucosaminyl deacetylase
MADKSVRVMVVGAHPLDPVERAGGVVAKHVERGDEAMLVSLTSGAVTHAFGFFPASGQDKLSDIQKVKDMKRAEFERAANILGIARWRMFDFPESPMLVGQQEYVELVNALREFRPDVVLCPHPTEVGRHDHMDCGRFTVACVDYCRAEGFPSPLAPHTVPNLFMFYYQDFRTEQLTGSPRHAPDVIVDISSTFQKKVAALCEFGTTQTRAGIDFKWECEFGLDRVDGGVGYFHGMQYAEQFVRFNPQRVQYLPLAG